MTLIRPLRPTRPPRPKGFSLALSALLALVASVAFPQEERLDILEYKKKASQAFAAGRFQEAIQEFRFVLDKAPRDQDSQISLALSLEANGELSDAQGLWKELYRATKENPYFSFALGRNYFYQGKFKEAEKIWTRHLPQIHQPSSWVNASPNDSRLAIHLYLLALTQHFLGKHKKSLEALDYLEKNLNIHMASISALKGDNLKVLGDKSQALAFYREGLSQDSLLAEIHRTLSHLQAGLGDFDNAFLEARRYMSKEEDKSFEPRVGDLARAITKSEEALLKEKEAGFDLSWPKKLEFFLSQKSPMIHVGLYADSLGNTPKLREATIVGGGSFRVEFEDKTPSLLGEANESLKISFIETPISAIQIEKKGSRPVLSVKPVLFKAVNKEGTSFLITGAQLAKRASGLQAPRQLRGHLVLAPKADGFLLANEVALEDYLLGVLPAEIGSQSPREAYRTQAALARTYSLWRLREDKFHRDRGDEVDLCDSVHCQVYRGYLWETDLARKALEETLGEALVEGSQIPRIWYHASCGGILSDSKTWDRPRPGSEKSLAAESGPRDFLEFFELTPFSYDGSEWCFEKKSRFSWIRLVSMEEIARKANQIYPNIGRLDKVLILERGEDSRVKKIELVGGLGRQIVDQDFLIRKILAPGGLRSCLFWMTPIGRNGKWEHLLFFGRGFGHGRGLCQVGAIRQAAKGIAYREILKFYYPQYELKKLY